MTDRATFEAEHDFALDAFQVEALDALDAGNSVLVAAPTGSGKTVVAEHAIERALAAGGKVFYTTPLKALSNQKFGDFVRRYGAGRVGLLTGDNSINGEAPVVVMTTEVLRNMIYAGSPTLAGLRYVVLDEVHYLQDRYRGPVWEEVIVHLPLEVDLVCLSATVSNAEEVAEWIATVRGATTAVIERRRPVALHDLYLVGERGHDELVLLPTFVGDGDGSDGDKRPNPEAVRMDRRVGSSSRHGPRVRMRLRTPGRVEVLDLLADEDLLPAITFIFSRAGCDQAVQTCLGAGLRLTNSDERAEIRRIAEAHTQSLSDDDLDVLGYGPWIAGLEAGIAAHHAGMVPAMKEAVEEAFAGGLVKMVYATETLALGINMPARSVVIEKLTKFTGERHDLLTPGEYTQLTGRAGRRGIDDVGYAVVCWNPFVTFEQVAALAARESDALRSAFRPTYNMAVNLVRSYTPERARELLNLSFAQFHADREVVVLERDLARTREQLERYRELATSTYGDAGEFRRLRTALDEARRGRSRARSVERALARVRPGDVLAVPSGRAVVLAHDQRRNRLRLVALDEARRHVVRLGADDFSAPPAVVGHIDLPQPFAPRSPAYRRAVLDALRQLRARPPSASKFDDGEVERVEAELAAHPVARDPDREARLRASFAVDRFERELARLERRARGRNESLARQLERVVDLLGRRRYIDGWSLTDAGEMLADLYVETDLLVAEAVRSGLLDGLAVPAFAAVASCFTYERRGLDSGGVLPPIHWPARVVADRVRAIERVWHDLVAAEEDARLPTTRPPDPGFTPYIYAWASGEPLAAVLEDEDELTGGDFVRNTKQCIDLLHQIADVAPNPATAAVARAAADACSRGVVAAAGAVAA